MFDLDVSDWQQTHAGNSDILSFPYKPPMDYFRGFYIKAKKDK
jgi:hypothetical protein